MPAKPSTKVQEPDARFFDRVSEDAGRIVQKEKLQEEYQKVIWLPFCVVIYETSVLKYFR